MWRKFLLWYYKLLYHEEYPETQKVQEPIKLSYWWITKDPFRIIATITHERLGEDEFNKVYKIFGDYKVYVKSDTKENAILIAEQLIKEYRVQENQKIEQREQEYQEKLSLLSERELLLELINLIRNKI